MNPAHLTDSLATAEVARMLGVSVASVNRYAADGRLPVAYRLPTKKGARIFRREDVEAFAASMVTVRRVRAS